MYKDASRRRAAFYTDKARLTSFVNGFKNVSLLVLSIKSCSHKASKTLCTSRDAESNYTALVQPYFDYCSPLWDNCGIGLKEKLQKYQNRAARILTGATYDIRTADVFETLAWETLEKRRDYLKSFFMYKILNNLAAPNLNRMFYKMSNCPISYNLRNSDTDLVLPQPKTEFKKKEFFL